MKIVFSDLDGTMLDRSTYSYEAATEGISILKVNEVPLVLVSSKTRPEMEELHKELELASPFIFENGAGIAYPRVGNRQNNKEKNDADYTIEISGKDIAGLLKDIHILTEALKSPVKTLLEMGIDEISDRTGLSKKMAEQSQQRTASLPFVLLSKKSIDIDGLNKINKIMKPGGLAVTKGGRFFHLSSIEANKGYAIKKIISYYKSEMGVDSIYTIGIGDSENDIPMLKSVNMPFLVKKHDGSIIKTGLNNIQITGAIGPAGFTEAIKSIF